MMYKIFFVLFAVAIFTGCAAGGGRPVAKRAPSYPNPETPEARAAFDQANDLYLASRFSDADAGFTQLITQFPYTELTDKARFYRGEIAFSKENYEAAILLYKEACSQIKSPKIAPMAEFKAAMAMYRLDRYDGALSQLGSIGRGDASPILRLRIDSLGVLASRAMKRSPRQYVLWSLRILDDYAMGAGSNAASVPSGDVIPDEEALNDARAWVDDETVTQAEVEALPLAEMKGKRSGGYAYYKQAYILHRSGNAEQSSSQLKAYLTTYPKHEYYGAARILMGELGGAIGEGAGVSIGVILPLSGRYAVYGQSVLHGLECALGIYDPCVGPAGVRLVIRDSEQVAGSAAVQVDQLAEEKVLAIVGPLMSKSAYEAAIRAQQIGMPMISLSQRDGIPEIGDYIFRNYVTPSSEVSTLVDYIFSNRHDLKRFFVLYPDNKKGTEYKDLFTTSVERWGGKIVGSSTYAPNQMEFGGGLRGRGATEQVAGLMIESPTYDAIFIPDSFQSVGYIIPTLALMGIRKTQLLGISRWDNKAIVERGGEFVEGALFVDSFFKEATDSWVASFVTKFHEAYGIEPTLLEASGYDTMRMLITAVQQKGASDRDTVKAALKNIVSFPGVAGKISFDENGDAKRELYVLTIKGGQIQRME